MQREIRGSKDSPIVDTRDGDFYHTTENLLKDGQDVYYRLNELVLLLSVDDRTLELVDVSSQDRVVILSAIALTMSLAQKSSLVPKATETILEARINKDLP